MTMTRALAVCLTLSAGSAQGRQTEPATIDTPSGPATIAGEWGFPTLAIGGRTLPLDEVAMSVEFGRRVGDLVLLTLYTGGSLCPVQYAWLDTRPGEVDVSQAFGTCSDLPRVAWDAETVTVTMPSMAIGSGIAFVYDGRTIREEERPPEPSGLPPGGDPLAWVGRSPSDLLGAPDWTPAMEALIGAPALDEAQRTIGLTTAMERQGGWVVGFLCKQEECDTHSAAVALSIPDGRPMVVLAFEGVPVRLWGDPRGAVPQTVLDVLAGR